MDKVKVELVGITTSSKRKECGAYTIEHVGTGAKYHGSTDNIHRRMIEHRGDLSRSEHGNKALQELVNNSPLLKVSFQPTETLEEARRIEESRILQESTTLLLNVSKDTSNPLIGLNHNPVVREKLRQAKLGNQNARGHQHDEKWKARQSESMKGNSHLLGHRHSDETKSKMSLRKLGVKKSPEAVARAAEGRTRNRAVIDGVTYSNVTAAGKALGLSGSGVKRRCESTNFPNWQLSPKVKTDV